MQRLTEETLEKRARIKRIEERKGEKKRAVMIVEMEKEKDKEEVIGKEGELWKE